VREHVFEKNNDVKEEHNNNNVKDNTYTIVM
jgi:hypothetical protein